MFRLLKLEKATHYNYSMKISDIKNLIEKILDNNKAKNIISINLTKKSYIADYMIIASGTSSRHLQSLSENLVSELKKIGISNCRIEGKDSSEWKLVDAIDIIVHIFHPDKRKFYDLEKMWSEPMPKEKALI
jgi:ribosome-associated protein